MSHDSQLLTDLPQGLEPGEGYCGDQEGDGIFIGWLSLGWAHGSGAFAESAVLLVVHTIVS